MDQETPFGLGAVHSDSHPDYRDGIVAGSVAADLATTSLPATYRSNLGSVLNQNQIPSCVSHSVTYLIRLWWFATHGEWVDFSPRFLDILSAEAWIPADGGRVPRTVLKRAVQYGICTTATLPNDTSLPIAQYRDKNAITQEAYAEALKYRIPGFIRIPIALATTRAAIMRYGAVSTLFQIGDELWTPSYSPADINPLRTPSSVVSGHQMTQEGWSTPALNALMNEWGVSWDEQGHADFDYQKWLPYISEQWAIAQIPQDVSDFLKNLPAPTDFSYQWQTDMKRGDVSQDVKFLQIAYMILGFLDPSSVRPQDLGNFGPKTSAANLKYQQAHKIFPTAPDHAGPSTRGALNAQFAI